MSNVRSLTVAGGLILLGVGGWLFWPASWTERQGASAPQATAAAPAQRGAERAIQVVTAPVRRGEVQQSYQAIGSANSSEAITITTKVTGIIKSINFVEGQFVEKGHVLVELDNRELKATLAASVADAHTARQNYERAAQLLSSGSAAKARVEDLQMALQAAEARAEAARARLADFTIMAPFGGRLGLRRISAGALVSQGTMITTLDDIGVVKLDFSMPETLIARVKPGAKVAARADALPGRDFEGIIRTVDSRVDPATRAVEVRAEVPNPEKVLQPGMLLAVQVILERREGALLIPEEALVPEGTQQFVYVIDNGRAAKKPITIGERLRGSVEVRDGLSEGTPVIIGGLQRLREGVAVRVSQGGGVDAGS